MLVNKTACSMSYGVMLEIKTVCEMSGGVIFL